MKNITLGLIFISLSTFSFGANVSTTKKETKSKINSYIKGKSCLQARNNLIKNGWKPFAQNKDDSPLEYQEAIMHRYPDLEYCKATGYGECYGSYKKGGQYLMVAYLAEGGGNFETPYCGVGDFKLSSSPL